MISMLEKLAGVHKALVPLVRKLQRLRDAGLAQPQIAKKIGIGGQLALKREAARLRQSQLAQAAKAGIPDPSKLIGLSASKTIKPPMPMPTTTSMSKGFNAVRQAGQNAALGPIRQSIDKERAAREAAAKIIGKYRP